MKIGFICGVFDLCHAGHIRALRECKSHCDYLILAINRAENLPTGKNLPIFSFEERKMIAGALKDVDEVLEYNSEEDLLQMLKSRRIDIRFLGEDYKHKPITGKELNIPIHFLDRAHGLSTTRVIEKILKRYSK